MLLSVLSAMLDIYTAVQIRGQSAGLRRRMNAPPRRICRAAGGVNFG